MEKAPRSTPPDFIVFRGVTADRADSWQFGADVNRLRLRSWEKRQDKVTFLQRLYMEMARIALFARANVVRNPRERLRRRNIILARWPDLVRSLRR